MAKRKLTAYECVRCDVAGDSPARQPSCWNCGRPDRVEIVARPTE